MFITVKIVKGIIVVILLLLLIFFKLQSNVSAQRDYFFNCLNIYNFFLLIYSFLLL